MVNNFLPRLLSPAANFYVTVEGQEWKRRSCQDPVSKNRAHLVFVDIFLRLVLFIGELLDLGSEDLVPLYLLLLLIWMKHAVVVKLSPNPKKAKCFSPSLIDSCGNCVIAHCALHPAPCGVGGQTDLSSGRGGISGAEFTA